MAPVLFISVFIIATCGLIYELIAGALASYILGDSITQFSLIIGLYLSSMGVGSYLSGFIDRKLLPRFIQIELLVALVGGTSAGMLFLTAYQAKGFHLFLYALVAITGILVGLEIPLLMRILKDELSLKDVVSRVLSLDYIGALVASLLFPIVLLPKLGLVQTGLLFGLLNAGVGLWGTLLLPKKSKQRLRLQVQGFLVIVTLIAGMFGADRLVSYAEARLFNDDIIIKVASPYQKLVFTRWKDDIRLFINNNLQFSSMDEYRYHEALVHPAMALAKAPREVLVLGGGDGFAVREVLKYPSIESVQVVDLDPEMTRLFSENPLLTALNQNAFADPRVKIINADAFQWLQDTSDFFDAVIIDFPDPNNHALGKLYSTAFYRLLKKRLSVGAVMVVQASSPFFTPRSFWCVVQTLESEGLYTQPYHTYVPSFGEWGYVLVTQKSAPQPKALAQVPLRFLSDELLPTLFTFPEDMKRVEMPPNRLDNQLLVQIYEAEWGRIF